MKFVGVSGINPSFGAQHLGHYASVCKTLDQVRSQGCCVLVLDDYLSRISLPSEIEKLNNRTLFIAAEYFSLGYDEPEVLLVRSSRLPELFSTIGLLSEIIDASTMMDIFRATALGRMSPSYRNDFGLDIPPKLAEVIYPAMVIPAMSVGLRADFVYGGLEVEGYLNTISHLSKCASRSNRSSLVCKNDHVKSPCSYVRGIDGAYMTNRNAIFISEPIEDVERKLSSIGDETILDEYLGFTIQNKTEHPASRSKKISSLMEFWTAEISHLTLNKMEGAIDIDSKLEANERIVRSCLSEFWSDWVGNV